MSELLVVVPEGWTDLTQKWAEGGADMGYVSMLINDKNWTDVSTELRGADITGAEGTTLTGATFMSMDDGIHFWARFE